MIQFKCHLQWKPSLTIQSELDVSLLYPMIPHIHLQQSTYHTALHGLVSIPIIPWAPWGQGLWLGLIFLCILSAHGKYSKNFYGWTDGWIDRWMDNLSWTIRIHFQIIQQVAEEDKSWAEDGLSYLSQWSLSSWWFPDLGTESLSLWLRILHSPKSLPLQAPSAAPRNYRCRKQSENQHLKNLANT